MNDIVKRSFLKQTVEGAMRLEDATVRRAERQLKGLSSNNRYNRCLVNLHRKVTSEVNLVGEVAGRTAAQTRIVEAVSKSFF